MSVESTHKVMQQYFDSHHTDVSALAEDVVFTVMATGQEYHGQAEVMGMLQYFYQIAFKGGTEDDTIIIDDGKAVFEGIFVGQHTGEFAGIPATGKNVRVPLCVVYSLKDDKIETGHVYFEMPVLMQQLSEKVEPVSAG